MSHKASNKYPIPYLHPKERQGFLEGSSMTVVLVNSAGEPVKLDFSKTALLHTSRVARRNEIFAEQKYLYLPEGACDAEGLGLLLRWVNSIPNEDCGQELLVTLSFTEKLQLYRAARALIVPWVLEALFAVLSPMETPDKEITVADLEIIGRLSLNDPLIVHFARFLNVLEEIYPDDYKEKFGAFSNKRLAIVRKEAKMAEMEMYARELSLEQEEELEKAKEEDRVDKA